MRLPKTGAILPLGKNDMIDNATQFGAAVASARKALGLTQRELALAINSGERFIVEMQKAKLHFFKEHVQTEKNPNRPIVIKKIETNKQLADIMTKGLVEQKFVPLRDKLMGWDLLPAEEPNVHSRGSVGSVNDMRRIATLRTISASSQDQSEKHLDHTTICTTSYGIEKVRALRRSN